MEVLMTDHPRCPIFINALFCDCHCSSDTDDCSGFLEVTVEPPPIIGAIDVAESPGEAGHKLPIGVGNDEHCERAAAIYARQHHGYDIDD